MSVFILIKSCLVGMLFWGELFYAAGVSFVLCSAEVPLTCHLTKITRLQQH